MAATVAAIRVLNLVAKRFLYSRAAEIAAANFRELGTVGVACFREDTDLRVLAALVTAIRMSQNKHDTRHTTQDRHT